MATNAGRGAYYKGRSKKHLERAGYQVADMELVRTVWTPNGPVPTKRDQWGSDLVAKNSSETVYVQVKSVAMRRRPDVAAAMRAFIAAGPWPPHTRRVVHVWRKFDAAPEVIECP